MSRFLLHACTIRGRMVGVDEKPTILLVPRDKIDAALALIDEKRDDWEATPEFAPREFTLLTKKPTLGQPTCAESTGNAIVKLLSVLSDSERERAMSIATDAYCTGSWPEPIKVFERYPDDSQTVLLSTNGGDFQQCVYKGGRIGFIGPNDLGFEINESSAWLPMPPKPEV